MKKLNRRTDKKNYLNDFDWLSSVTISTFPPLIVDNTILEVPKSIPNTGIILLCTFDVNLSNYGIEVEILYKYEIENSRRFWNLVENSTFNFPFCRSNSIKKV